ncbi:hypothetical protein V6Z12_A12G172100 [Gossypium hirsutum]
MATEEAKTDSESKAYQMEKKLEKRPVSEESPPKSPPPKKVSKSLMIQQEDQNPLTKFLKDYIKSSIPKISTIQNPESCSEADSGESSDSSDESFKEFEYSSDEKTESEYEELQKAFQTTKVEEPSDDEMQDMPESSSVDQRQIPKSSIGRTTFTIDDLPPAKWPDRIQEFHSWLETRKLTEDGNYDILMEFVSRFTGMLRDWWNFINQHDQMQFLVLQDLAQPIRIIHQHFVENPQDLLTLKRREFYKRKCYSYVKRDLEKHFKIMTKLYYALGLNPNLKPVILSSLPNPIQVAVNQALQTQNKDILQITVGELQQEVFVALEDICTRRMIFKDYLHGDKRIDRACDDSHLKYKCPKDHLCDCRTKKKKHFKKTLFFSNFKKKKVRPRWRYLKKKRKSTKSDRCYICNQKGHFSKNYPKNKKQAKKIAQIVKQSGVKIQENDDIESVCSIKDEPSDKTICAIPAFPVPHVPVKIYLDKYSKPITIIAFIDTGAAETIMNADILPPKWWKPHIRYFDSAADVSFATHMISKPITIQFFPSCCVKTTVLGSKLLGKDIVVGFDLYKKAQHLRILPEGVRFKNLFQPFVRIPKLSFNLKKSFTLSKN